MEAGVRREGSQAREERGLGLGTVCADREDMIGFTIDKLTLAVPRDQTGRWGREQGPMGGCSCTQASKEETDGKERMEGRRVREGSRVDRAREKERENNFLERLRIIWGWWGTRELISKTREEEIWGEKGMYHYPHLKDEKQAGRVQVAEATQQPKHRPFLHSCLDHCPVSGWKSHLQPSH